MSPVEGRSNNIAASAHKAGTKQHQQSYQSGISCATAPTGTKSGDQRTLATSQPLPKGKRARTPDAENNKEPPNKQPRLISEKDQALAKISKTIKANKKTSTRPDASSAIQKPPTGDAKEGGHESKGRKQANASIARRSYRMSRIVFDSDDEFPPAEQSNCVDTRSARLKRKRVIESDDEESDPQVAAPLKGVAAEDAQPPKKVVKLSKLELVAMALPARITDSMLKDIKVQKHKRISKAPPTTTPSKLQSLSPKPVNSSGRQEGKTTWIGRGQSWKPLRGPDTRHDVLNGASQTNNASPHKPSSARPEETYSQMPGSKVDTPRIHLNGMGASGTRNDSADNKRKAESSPNALASSKRQRMYEDSLLDSYAPPKDDGLSLAAQKRNSLKRKKERLAAEAAYAALRRSQSQSASRKKRSQALAKKTEANKTKGKTTKAKNTETKNTELKNTGVKKAEVKKAEATQTEATKTEAIKIKAKDVLAKEMESKKTETKKVDAKAKREPMGSLQSKAAEKKDSRPTESVNGCEKGPSAADHHGISSNPDAAFLKPNTVQSEIERTPSKSTGDGEAAGHTASANRLRRDTFDSGYVSKSATHSPPDSARPQSVKYPVVPAFGFHLPLPKAAQAASGAKSQSKKQVHAKGTGDTRSKLHITSTHEEVRKGEK